MPDVEFLDTAGADGDDEVLDTGPRRRLPRWLGPLAAIGLVALVVSVVLVRNAGSDPQATTSPSPVPSSSTNVSSTPLAGGQIVDMVADTADGRIVALIGAKLFSFAPHGAVPMVSQTLQTSGGSDPQVNLFYDPRHDIVWAVRQGLPIVNRDNPGVVEGFSGRTLKQVGRAVLPAPAQGAAVLDGSLYVATSGTMFRLDVGDTTFRRAAPLDLGGASPIADPARHRLLYVQYGNPVRLRALDGRASTAGVTLPFLQGSVVVVGSTIWAGGTDAHGAVLARLNPTTLRAGPNIAGRLPVGQSIVLNGGGQRSLYVRPIRGASDELLCVDGRTGAVRSRLPRVRGLFAVVDGRGYVGLSGRVDRIDIGGCPG